MHEESTVVDPVKILEEHDPEKLADRLEEELKQIQVEKEEENEKHPDLPGVPKPYE